MKHLGHSTEYLFRVSAANKHGFSKPGRVSEPIMTVDKNFANKEDEDTEDDGMSALLIL